MPPAYEVLLLNTAVPQIQAAQSGDTYVVPRDIAFSAALTLSAGTANGVPYLNASKVLTTGSALTFDGARLVVGNTDTTVLGVKGVTKGVRFDFDSTGSVIYGVDSTFFGSYQPLTIGGSDTRFATSGSEQMRLTSTGLGIGTSSPGAKLDVNTGGASNTMARFTSNGSYYSYILSSGVTSVFSADTNGNNSFTVRGASNQLEFYTNAAERMRLDSSGNLGLGVTPSAWGSYKAIQVNSLGISGSTGDGGISFNSFYNGSTWKFIADGQATLYNQYQGQHRFFNSNNVSGSAGGDWSPTQAMTLDASGNLVVGFTSAASILHVRASSATITVDDSGDGTSKISFRPSAASYAERAALSVNYGTAEMRLAVGASGGNFFQTFYTNNTERARITSGGDFQTSSGGSVQVGGTAARATTAGTNRLDIFDGTAPVGTLANGVSFYSTAGEARVMDAAGNATLLSPHDTETNEWIFHSKHTPTGKVLRIDVERLLKFVNDHFGLDAVQEFIEE